MSTKIRKFLFKKTPERSALEDIPTGGSNATNQAALAIDPDMALHAKVPRIDFFGQPPLRIAWLILVLDQRQPGDQDDRQYIKRLG